jgi:hypothetical protein
VWDVDIEHAWTCKGVWIRKQGPGGECGKDTSLWEEVRLVAIEVDRPFACSYQEDPPFTGNPMPLSALGLLSGEVTDAAFSGCGLSKIVCCRTSASFVLIENDPRLAGLDECIGLYATIETFTVIALTAGEVIVDVPLPDFLVSLVHRAVLQRTFS